MAKVRNLENIHFQSSISVFVLHYITGLLSREVTCRHGQICLLPLINFKLPEREGRGESIIPQRKTSRLSSTTSYCKFVCYHKATITVFFYFNLSSQKLSNSIHHKNSFCCPVDWAWILGRGEVEQVCLPILCQTEKVADKDVRAKYAHANCLQAIKASRKNWQIAKNRLNGNAPSSNQIVETIFLRAQHKKTSR